MKKDALENPFHPKNLLTLEKIAWEDKIWTNFQLLFSTPQSIQKYANFTVFSNLFSKMGQVQTFNKGGSISLCSFYGISFKF